MPPPQDTFQDYQEMFVQFGYVVLFSSAFPLAALCALVNNLIEIRSDALKLCTGLQRPFGQRVENIGQWQVWEGQGLQAKVHREEHKAQGGGLTLPYHVLLQKVMEAMGVLAIVVNCYLIGQCGQLQRLFPWLSPEAAIVSVVVLEVGLFAGLGGQAGEPGCGWWSLSLQPPPLLPQHFALLLKYLIHVAIPDIPGWVAEEMAKLEYQRREAFKVRRMGLGSVYPSGQWAISSLPGWQSLFGRRAAVQSLV